MDNPVNDGFITADFIGGAWDGKTYDIPFMPEWRIALMRPLSYHVINEKPDPKEVFYDIAVYRYVGHGLYWFSRIEKNG